MTQASFTRRLPHLAIALLAFSFQASSQDNTWGKVRYVDGSVRPQIDAQGWDNQLTVSSTIILLKLKGAGALKIPTNTVTGVSYGRAARLRMSILESANAPATATADMATADRAARHYIEIEYAIPDREKSAILIEGNDGNYKAILIALRHATGVSVAVSKTDRQYLPPGVEGVSAQTRDDGKRTEGATESPVMDDSAEMGVLIVSSTPPGSLVSIDGQPFGGAPVAMRLPTGKHSIKLSLSGYKEFAKEITLGSGSEEKVEVVLEKQE
jgi:hypothetical protein